MDEFNNKVEEMLDKLDDNLNDYDRIIKKMQREYAKAVDNEIIKQIMTPNTPPKYKIEKIHGK